MSEQKEKPRDTRQEQIDWHCSMQQCIGCPKEYECDEAEAFESDVDCKDEYDGEDFDY